MENLYPKCVTSCPMAVDLPGDLPVSPEFTAEDFGSKIATLPPGGRVEGAHGVYYVDFLRNTVPTTSWRCQAPRECRRRTGHDRVHLRRGDGVLALQARGWPSRKRAVRALVPCPDAVNPTGFHSSLLIPHDETPLPFCGWNRIGRLRRFDLVHTQLILDPPSRLSVRAPMADNCALFKSPDRRGVEVKWATEVHTSIHS